MNPASALILSPHEVIRLLAVHWRRWLLPAAVVAVLTAIYAAVASPTWQASQALIIRNEAANNETSPGKFTRNEEMKTVQETILELSKSRGVLLAALGEIGPPADCKDKESWPSDREVESLRETVKLAAPKGAEFGATEVFYLEVRDSDRVRVVRLNRAICDQLLARFQQLRDAKAQSMIAELNKSVRVAKADLEESTARLSEMEKQVGSDLAELRVLQDANSGDSALRRTLTEIENELRQTRTAQKAAGQLLELLRAAKEDPGRLLATPNRLLESEPALRRLKDGLVDAQLRTAALEGRMAEAHPLVQAAKQAEAEVARYLHEEITAAIHGVQTELRLHTERIAMLEGQLAQAKGRLARLAGMRAVYVNQVAETNHRARLAERAEQNLAEARATQASAKAASLISYIDTPDAGIRPLGPSRSLILLVGIAGGLAVGLGVVFFTVQPAQAAAGLSKLPENHAERINRTPSGTAPAAAPPAIFEPVGLPATLVGNLSLKQALRKIACGNGA